MNQAQRTRQQQACHIEYKRLVGDGAIDGGITVYQYAGQVIGRNVESLKDLTDFELNALRDRLNGKPNKLLCKLAAAATAAGIRDLAVWMRAVGSSKGLRWLAGHTPETLPVSKQYRLVKILETRARRKG